MSEGNVKLCKDLQSLPTHIHHLRQIIFDTLKIFNLIFLNKVLLNIIFIQFPKDVKPGPLFIPPSNKARCASPPPPLTQTCCKATNTSQTCIQTFVINIPCRILTPPPFYHPPPVLKTTLVDIFIFFIFLLLFSKIYSF